MRMAETPEEALRRTLEALARAELERDVPTLERIIHEQYQGVDPAGELLSKEHVVDTYGGGLFVLQTLVMEEQNVRVLGSTGVVTASSTMRGRTPDGEFEQRYRFTDVYVRENGEWRLFASHMTPLRRTAGFHALDPTG
jgi:hypothetical protein